MMNKLSRANLPNKCWIHNNRRYSLLGLSLPKLPHVALKYERILKANDIPYRKVLRPSIFDGYETEEVLEYWNPKEGLEEEDLTLPLFAKMPNYSYVSCQKNYTQKVPTAESIKAAERTEVFIETQIAEYDEILRAVCHYRFAKEKLADNIVTVCISNSTPYVPFYDIEMNHDHFKIFRIPGAWFPVSDWVVIFNMNKVAPNGHLTIQVPEHMAHLVIGKCGSNIKSWAEKLGVKEIHVIPTKE